MKLLLAVMALCLLAVEASPFWNPAPIIRLTPKNSTCKRVRGPYGEFPVRPIVTTIEAPELDGDWRKNCETMLDQINRFPSCAPFTHQKNFDPERYPVWKCYGLLNGRRGMKVEFTTTAICSAGEIHSAFWGTTENSAGNIDCREITPA